MNKEKYSVKASEARKWGIVTLALTLFQIVYGAYVAGLKAGFIHPTWPKMSNDWIDPSIGQALNRMGVTAFWEDAITIQFVHRWFAFAVLAMVLFSIFQTRMLDMSTMQRKANKYLLVAVSAQILLGIMTLIMHVPITIAVAHQLVALVLLMTTVYFIFANSRVALKQA